MGPDRDADTFVLQVERVIEKNSNLNYRAKEQECAEDARQFAQLHEEKKRGKKLASGQIQKMAAFSGVSVFCRLLISLSLIKLY
jgi:hypothetical protein